MSFRADVAGIGSQQRQVVELGGDVTRAKFYATTNIQMTGQQGVLAQIAPSIDSVRGGIETVLDSVKKYLDGSSTGLEAAVKLYQNTDRERAAALDATYPDGGSRPAYTGQRTPTDTRPGPSSDSERKDWDEYQSEHKVDTGPGNPSAWQRPGDPPPVITQAPPAPPQSPTPQSTTAPQPPSPAQAQPTPPTPQPGPSPKAPR